MIHSPTVATVVPQAFEQLVQLLQTLALDNSGAAAKQVGLSVPGLAALLGQQAPTR
jgi:hypothetical protein